MSRGPAEGSAGRLVRNTLANGATSVAGVLVFLVLTPFVILQLGATEYGVLTLALSISFLGGYAGLTDLGVEAATARFVAEARSDGDHLRVNRLASTTAVFFMCIAAALTAPLAALASPLVDAFGVPAALRDAATWCFVLIALQLIVEMPARTYFAVLEGAQRFDAYQACEMVRILTQAALWVAALVSGLGMVALAGAVPLTSLVVLVVARTLAHRVVPDLRVSPRLASRSTFRQVVGFGGSLLALRVSGVLYRQMDRIVIGAALGPRSVTVYEIANKIQSAAQLVQSVAASALIPAAAFARAQRAVLQDMFLRGSAYSLAVSLPFVATVLIFAEPLIVTWIDPKYADAASVARWFALYLGLAGFLIVGATMIVALGRLRFLIVVNFVVIAVNLALSIALVGPLGIDGVVIGSVVAYAASWPLQLGYVLRELGIPVAQWLRRVVAPQLPGIVVQAAVSLPLLRVAESAGSVVVVGLLALVPIAASLAVFVALGLRGADRAALFTTLRSALGRHAPAPAERPPA